MASFDKMLGAAKMAVEVCAAVKQSEGVLILTDTNKVGVANVLAKASEEAGARGHMSRSDSTSILFPSL